MPKPGDEFLEQLRELEEFNQMEIDAFSDLDKIARSEWSRGGTGSIESLIKRAGEFIRNNPSECARVSDLLLDSNIDVRCAAAKMLTAACAIPPQSRQAIVEIYEHPGPDSAQTLAPAWETNYINEFTREVMLRCLLRAEPTEQRWVSDACSRTRHGLVTVRQSAVISLRYAGNYFEEVAGCLTARIDDREGADGTVSLHALESLLQLGVRVKSVKPAIAASLLAPLDAPDRFEDPDLEDMVEFELKLRILLAMDSEDTAKETLKTLMCHDSDRVHDSVLELMCGIVDDISYSTDNADRSIRLLRLFQPHLPGEATNIAESKIRHIATEPKNPQPGN